NPFLSWYHGPFGFLTEYVRSSYDASRGGNSQTVDTDGFTVQASWVLTGENASYGAIRPKRPFNLSSGDWGSIELGIRYSALEVDDSAFGDPATQLAHGNAVQKAESYGIGLNWNPYDNLRVALNYEQTDFSG